MKRAFAFLLALAMVFSLGVTAFAAETNDGTITITNTTIGKDYAIYKLFDATIQEPQKEGDKKAVAYTIETDNQFFATLFGTDGKTDNLYFQYNPNTGSVTKKDGVNDSELLKYLSGLVTATETYQVPYTPTQGPKTADAKTVTFDNLPYGYYLITSSLGTTVTINSSTPDVEVIDKNQEPGIGFDKQVETVDAEGKTIWADSNSANIGDKFSYKISFEATNYDGDKKIQHYQIHDQKGEAIWAEFESFTVKVNGEELPRGYYLPQGGENTGNWKLLGNMEHKDSWVKYGGGEDRNKAQWYLVHLGKDEFRITIPWLEGHTLSDVTADGAVVSYKLEYPENAESLYNSPAKVEVTYDVIIEPDASIGGTTHGNRFNKANASWTSAHETGSTPPDEVVTQVYGIGLLKDDANTGLNLAGAKFRIYRDKECTNDPVYVIPTKIDGVYIVDSLGSDAAVSGDANDGRELSRVKYAAYLEEYLGADYETKQDNYVVSQVNGKLAVLGLAAGTYYLKEVEAPSGYNALTLPIEIKAGEGSRPFNIFANENGDVADIQQTDGVHTENIYDLTYTVVHNSKGVELPSTGGAGKMMLLTFGSMIAMAFAVLMITQKKMSIYKD